MIRIYCRAADALLKETQTLTNGMTNYPEVLLTFSDDWDGFGKAVVVRAGETTVDVLLRNNKFIVPAECLENAGVNLIIGVSGSDGIHTIPTIWCSAGEILEGTDIDEADNVGTATPTLVEQMLGYAGEIEQYAEDMDQNVIRSVLVDASRANRGGTVNVYVRDSGAGENRTLTFVFENLKGEGIYSINFVATGENRGRVSVFLDNGTIKQYDGIKDALDALDAFEAGVAAEEALRVAAEALRATAEQNRNVAEGQRVSAESDRLGAESARITAENGRATAEAARATAEAARASAESDRATAESGRATAEQGRVTAESARANAESARVTAEASRATAEAERETAEAARETAESGRASAESTRQSNESSRQNAEAARVTEFESWEETIEEFDDVLKPYPTAVGEYLLYCVVTATDRTFEWRAVQTQAVVGSAIVGQSALG